MRTHAPTTRPARRRGPGRLAPLLALCLALAACGAREEGEPEHGEAAHGPHGGRLLESGPLSFEVEIFERAAAPELRVYVYRDGELVDPREVELAARLRRLGGEVDELGFAAAGEYLRSEGGVEEPHSFDVELSARVAEKDYAISYAAYEGRVLLPEDAREAAGIGVATAGPAALRTTLPLHGRIVPDEDALAHLTPRFPGVAREVRKRVGDAVARQEVLAIIESNASLRPYELRSPLSGAVIFKELSAGEFVAGDRVVYAVADLSRVWADFYVHPPDYPRLRVGQRITLSGGPDGSALESALSYLSPIGSQGSQTLLARAVIPNESGAWPPGLFVRGDVVVDEAEVPVSVRSEGVQRLGDMDVVFVRFGDVFEARPVALGRRDGGLVEVRSGVEAGWRYAAENSFVLKADVEKAGASHDH